MDFMSFKKQHTSTKSTPAQPENSSDNIRKTAEEYAKKSDAELLRDIMQAANIGKKDGSLSEDKLRQFVTSVSPMLNDEQRARLNSVVKMINKS